jgi:hypothetical protein
LSDITWFSIIGASLNYVPAPRSRLRTAQAAAWRLPNNNSASFERRVTAHPAISDLPSFAPFVKGEASEGSGRDLDISRRLCCGAGIDRSSDAGVGGRVDCSTLKLADR